MVHSRVNGKSRLTGLTLREPRLRSWTQLIESFLLFCSNSFLFQHFLQTRTVSVEWCISVCTDELLSQSDPLPQVSLSQHDHVDHAHQRHHVRDVICGVKLIHDDAESILLLLETLNTNDIYHGYYHFIGFITVKASSGFSEEPGDLIRFSWSLLTGAYRCVVVVFFWMRQEWTDQ